MAVAVFRATPQGSLLGAAVVAGACESSYHHHEFTEVHLWVSIKIQTFEQLVNLAWVLRRLRRQRNENEYWWFLLKYYRKLLNARGPVCADSHGGSMNTNKPQTHTDHWVVLSIEQINTWDQSRTYNCILQKIPKKILTVIKSKQTDIRKKRTTEEDCLGFLMALYICPSFQDCMIHAQW